MQIAILIIVVVFSFLSFTLNLPGNSTSNILNGYFLNALGFIGKHIFIFLGFFIFIGFLVLKSLKLEKKHPKKNHIAIIITQTVFVFVTGIFCSFLLILFVAILELNIFALLIDINPGILGIKTDIKLINSMLIKQNLSPVITSSENNHYKELLAITKETTGLSSFYGKYVLSSIPSFLVLPTGKIGSTILIDKTLIISDINKSELEQITPTIVYLYIKNYFYDRYIKHFPKYSIMSPKEYKKFRSDDYAGKFKTISDKLNETNLQISTTSAAIQNDKTQIAFNQNLINLTYEQKNKANNKCVAEGYYNNSGIYIKTNTKEYCNNQNLSFEKIIQSANEKIDFYTKDLNKNNALLKSYESYADFFKAQSSLTNYLKVNIPLELALFVPENEIKMVIDNTPRGIAEYFETATHEYLHYASRTKDGKQLQVALFEEGVTEYFAKNIIKNSLNVDTNIGYPAFAKIISVFTKIIPEAELADYYFSKDQVGLEKALNRVYGDNFYKNNLLLFETLQYTSDNKQLLKFTNTLMDKIKEKHFKEIDLISL
jgi:hypothetical protein